ncbi:hypothetical protein AB6A40_011238 [Gnathostoma spinigerum]|uniref:Uncharacterized protein n=1 Tax=Gnathostoma spinigerum TaxID=75299 RepID=A0ABD6F316_9BILA
MGESRSAGYLDNVRDRSFDDYDRCRDSPRRYGPSHSRDRSYARQPYRQRQQGFGVNNGLPQNSEHRRFAWAETVSQSPVGLAHGSMTMTSVGLSTPLQRYANVPPINMRSPNVIPAFQSPQAVYSSPSYFQETRGVYCTPSQGLVVHRSYSYFQ